MPEMKIRRSGIEPRFNSQRSALFEFGDEFFFGKNLDRTAFNDLELCLRAGHAQ